MDVVAVWSWFAEPFALEFQQRALLGGVLAGVMCAVVGTWLVLRGMSFFGDAFVHGVVPGLAAAVVLDINPMLGAAVAAAVMVAGIGLVGRQTMLSEDTAIGLLFVGMLALGVVIISSVDSYTGSLTSILFGDALGVTRSDLLQQAALAVIVLGACLVMYRPFLALAFNRQKAELLGMRPGRAHGVLLTLLAASVIGSSETVGTMLVFGLLIGPPATAILLVRTVPRMMVLSAGISVGSVWFGLILSYHLETAASATMALVPIVGFFAVLVGNRIAQALRSTSGPQPAPEVPATVSAVYRPSDGAVVAEHLAPSAARDGEPASQGVDVVLAYGDHTALRRSSFLVPSGRITAVIGPNGSGKSTLLHAIAGLLPPARGDVRTLGGPASRARTALSYVLQSMVVPPTTPMTVYETVAMGRYPSLGWFRRFGRHDHLLIEQAMHRLQIEDLAGGHLHELSGGQRQRVYVAQGLVQDHQMLVLDEPLTGLDIVSARTIDRIIHEERAAGRSVVLTTHDLDEARAADHVILVNGRIIAAGPPDEVCTRTNLEVAFGLGSLHGWKGFLDDPAHDPHGVVV